MSNQIFQDVIALRDSKSSDIISPDSHVPIIAQTLGVLSTVALRGMNDQFTAPEREQITSTLSKWQRIVAIYEHAEDLLSRIENGEQVDANEGWPE